MSTTGFRSFAVVVAAFLLLSWVRLDPGGTRINATPDDKSQEIVERGDTGPDAGLDGPSTDRDTNGGPTVGEQVRDGKKLTCDSKGNGGPTDRGVTATRIKLATTAVLDGAAKTLLEESPVAMKAVIDKVNRAGGICGRLLDLRVVNDSFKADVGLRSIQNFIAEDKFALPVVPSAEGLGSAISNGDISKAGIPVVGTDGMRNEQYGDPFVWPVASATVTTMRVMAKYGYAARNARTFAIVYDEKYKFGKEGKDAFVSQVKALGGELVTSVGLNPEDSAYGPTANSFNEACSDGKCDMVALLLLPDTAKKWLQANAAFGKLYTAGAQTLFTDRFARDCVLVRGRGGAECHGFAVWTGYNPPIGPLKSKPGVASYVNDVTAVKPGIDVNNQFVEGAYLGMSVFVEALRRVGPDLTRERLRQVMDSMTYESDLASTLTWRPGKHAANVRSQSFSMTVSQGAFRGWSDEGTGFLLDPAHGG